MDPADDARILAAHGAPPRGVDRPRTPRDLHDWLRRLGYWIAYRPAVDGMQAPLEAFWAAYSGQHPAMVVQGGRDSGKTQGLALVELSKAHFHPGYAIAHVGGTSRQAHRCYGYVRELLGAHPDLRGAVQRSILSETNWINGSRLEVMPATLNAVSGGHPQMLCIDEFDLVDWQVFQQAIGMPHSTREHAAVTVLTSTLYRSDGTMRATLQAEQAPKLFRWSVLDALEPCDGFGGRPSCLDAEAAASGRPASVPPHCPLWDNGCAGAARRATGHKKRQDAIAALQLADEYTWRTQHLSQDAERRGLMYEHFAGDLSDDGTTNVSEDAEYDPGLDVYWGADAGYEHPSVVLLGQVRPDGLIAIVDEVYLRHLEHEAFLNAVHQPRGLDGASPESWYVAPRGHSPRGPYRKPRRVFPDPSAKEFQRQLAKRLRSAARVRAPLERVMDGVAVVRRYLRDHAGRRRLLIHPRCERLIRELRYWRAKQVAPGVWVDEPEPNAGDSNPDHACDALRYLVQNVAVRRRAFAAS